MNQTLTKMNLLTLLKSFVVLTCIFLISCGSSDDNNTIAPPKNNPVPETPDNGDNGSTPDVPDVPSPNGNTNYTNEVDRKFLKQLKGYMDFYQSGASIEDYALWAYPIYLVSIEGGSFFNTVDGKPVHGFIINPTNVVSNMKKLGANEYNGLNIYRYDDPLEKAANYLKTAINDTFSFRYKIEGQDGTFYMQAYNKSQVIGLDEDAAINTLAHEAHHAIHQERGHKLNKEWRYIQGSIQDYNSFPFTKELAELQILVSEIFREFPNVTDKNILREKLKQYVAIRSKEMEIDPSDRKLIKNMCLTEERKEGGAYFVEIGAHRNYFKENTLYYGYTYGIPMEPTKSSTSSLRDTLGHWTFYPAGASVLHAISIIDKQKLQEYDTKTPFQIASDLLNMTEQEKKDALAAAKASVDWAAIQKRAADETP